MSPSSLPALPGLKLPPEVVTIGSMLIGLATLVATTLGVSPDVTSTLVLGIQYALAALFVLGGVVGHLHLHQQHVTLQRALLTPTPSFSSATVNAALAPSTTLPLPVTYTRASPAPDDVPGNPPATNTVAANAASSTPPAT